VSIRTFSLHLNGHFSRWTWVSQFYWELRMMEVVVTTGAISRVKLQSNHHQQQTNTQVFTGWCPPVAQPTVSKHGGEAHETIYRIQLTDN